MNFRQTRRRRFSSPEVPFAVLKRPLDRLARKSGLNMEEFRGDDVVMLRLPSAGLVRIQRPQPQWNPGEKDRATVFVGTADIVKHGVKPIMQDLLRALNLPKRAVGWRIDAKRSRLNLVKEARKRYFQPTF